MRVLDLLGMLAYVRSDPTKYERFFAVRWMLR